MAAKQDRITVNGRDYMVSPLLAKDLEEERSKQFVQSFDQMCMRVHAVAVEKGWWPSTGRNTAEMIALIHSELSEALEAARLGVDIPDDQLIMFTNFEVELADAMIRIMDLATAMQLDLGAAIVEKTKFNRKRPFMHGGKAF